MNYKKMLSIFLIVAMCCSFVPIGVFAEEENSDNAQEALLQTEASAAESEGASVDSTAVTEDKLPEGYVAIGDFVCKINEENALTIQSYKGKDSNLTIPAKLTVPGETAARPVSTIAYNAMVGKECLESLTIEEGVIAIEEGAFYNCKNLAKVDLPSSIITLGYTAFEKCALTNTDGFSKLKNLKNNTSLELSNNNISDLTGLKGLNLSTLYLNNNKNLSDISPLKEIKSLKTISLFDTAVTADTVWNMTEFAPIELSAFDIDKEILASPIPVIWYGNNQCIIDELTFESSAPDVVSIQNKTALKIIKLGEATIKATYKEDTKQFKVTVKDFEPAPDPDKPVENVPTLQFHRVPDGMVNLELKENGELWNISSDTPTLIKTDVKSITTNTSRQSKISWLFIQDKNDSLWVQEAKVGKTPTLSQKVENVQKYVGNNAYAMDFSAQYYITGESAWSWVLTKDGGVTWAKGDGSVTPQKIEAVRDIENLEYQSRAAGVLALKEDDTLWYKSNSDKSDFQKLADSVASISSPSSFLDKEGNTHFITVTREPYGLLQAKEEVNTSEAVKWFRSFGNGNFYIDKNGATWFSSYSIGAPAKVGDMTMAYTPIYTYKYYNDTQTGNMVHTYDYYFQDTEKNFWKYDTALQNVTKIADNVKKTNIVSLNDNTGNIKGTYLKTDGTLVDVMTQKQISDVADMMGDYLFYKDGRVTYQNKTILTSVKKVGSSTDSGSASNNYTYASDCYMTRSDGSVWMHTPSKPGVIKKVANYPEMAPVKVTGVSVAPTTLEMTAGDAAAQLTATVAPADAGNKAVTWSSSNDKVAKVDAGGKVTPVSAGKANITVTTTDGGHQAVCAVSVNKPIVHVQSVSVSPESISNMTIGYYGQLTAKVSPADADNQSVKWSSSNAGIASVDGNGRVTAMAAGDAVITATTVDGGKTASATVNIKPNVTETKTDPVVPNQPTKPVEVSNTEVAIVVPQDVISKVNPEIEGAVLKVESVMDNPQAQQIIETAKNEVQKIISENEKSEMLQLLDFKFEKDGTKVEFDGTQAGVAVKLTVKITPAQRDAFDYYQVYAVNEDGTLGEKVADKLNPDNDSNIAFNAFHFSKYILVGVVNTPVPVPDPNPDPDPVPVNKPEQAVPVGTEVKVNVSTGIGTNETTTPYVAVGLVVIAIAGLAVYAKRRNAK